MIGVKRIRREPMTVDDDYLILAMAVLTTMALIYLFGLPTGGLWLP
jgi:hypothetical protein